MSLLDPETLKKFKASAFIKGRQMGSINIPLLRSTFPKLIAEELISVQPMTEPVGKLNFITWNLVTKPEPKFIEFFKEEEFNL